LQRCEQPRERGAEGERLNKRITLFDKEKRRKLFTGEDTARGGKRQRIWVVSGKRRKLRVTRRGRLAPRRSPRQNTSWDYWDRSSRKSRKKGGWFIQNGKIRLYRIRPTTTINQM